MARGKRVGERQEKEPPKTYSPRRLKLFAEKLNFAATLLQVSAHILEIGDIPFAYFQLGHIEGTLMEQVLKYAKDAKNLADIELAAKRQNKASARIKSVQKYWGDKASTPRPDDDLDAQEADLQTQFEALKHQMEMMRAASANAATKPVKKGAK